MLKTFQLLHAMVLIFQVSEDKTHEPRIYSDSHPLRHNDAAGSLLGNQYRNRQMADVLLSLTPSIDDGVLQPHIQPEVLQ
jgi:hypothetical protein